MSAFPATRGEMLNAGYKYGSTEQCKGCQATIEFWYTPQNTRIPMNPMREADSAAPVKSHFATCPQAEEFRRKKGRGCRQPAKSATTQTSFL